MAYDWSRLNNLGKTKNALQQLRKDDAVLARLISDLAAQWRANASIAAYLIDAGPWPRPAKGRR